MTGIDPLIMTSSIFSGSRILVSYLNEVIHLQFTHIVFCLHPSPAILGSVFTYHIKKFDSEFPELTKKLRDSFLCGIFNYRGLW